MTHEESITALFANWAEGQLDPIVARFAPDAVWHFSAATKPPAIGRAAIAGFLRDYASIARNSRIAIIRAAERGDTLFFEGVDRFCCAGHEVTTPYAGVVTFHEGLIADWRDYFDRGLIDGQLTGERPLPTFAEALLALPTLP